VVGAVVAGAGVVGAVITSGDGGMVLTSWSICCWRALVIRYGAVLVGRAVVVGGRLRSRSLTITTKLPSTTPMAPRAYTLPGQLRRTLVCRGDDWVNASVRMLDFGVPCLVSIPDIAFINTGGPQIKNGGLGSVRW